MAEQHATQGEAEQQRRADGPSFGHLVYRTQLERLGGPEALSSNDIHHVGVVGAGLMGSGIIEVCARAGCSVTYVEGSSELVAAGRDRIVRSLSTAVERGKIAGPDADHAMASIAGANDLRALADVDLAIEAASEDPEAKRNIFARLGEVTRETVVLASNTSSIPIGSLGEASGRPASVIGMHFFNPVPVLKLVEVIRAVQTSDETAAAIVALARELGKEPAEARDFPGFVSNRILMPFVNEAAYALMEGVAEAEAIDTIARLGFAHPMGPLALADLIGLDTCVAIMDVLHEGLGDPKYAPCPLLRQYVQAGRLGRKSGRGFYEYG
jgi:3-hydroxybutyryl-CoA dehydrogenase